MKGCDSCIYFVKIKWDDKGVGICEYEDGRLYQMIKSCPNYKSKKYGKEERYIKGETINE